MLNWLDLDRQYFEWRSGEFTDLAMLRMSKSRLGWADLQTRRRVILLAEGGSGKSREVQARARLLKETGQFAVVATILDVDKAGSLEAALRPSERANLDAWRSSEDNGWFFLDSIDEAKRNSVRFQRVAGLVADAISGHEGRAHVVFTGRPADWETRADLESLLAELPIPPPPSTVPAPDRNELLVNIIRRRRIEPATPVEAPLVVVMAPLDIGRIERYVAAHAVQNSAGLVQAIAHRDLGSLAGRPLDLHWITEFWKSQGRLGSLRDMLQRSLTERLTERRPGAAAGDALTEATALEALERVGAALVFARKRGIQIPDSDAPVEALDDSADLVAILPDWTGLNRSALLRRAAFEPGPLGTVQLHSDNNGDVRAYLASRWLHRLRTQFNLASKDLLDLLFAKTYEIRFVRPALKETAAWLAANDNVVASEMIEHAPSLLLTMGDPESLPMSVRQRALEAVCRQIAVAPDQRSALLEHDGLKRFAALQLSPTIRTLWQDYASCVDVRTLLIQLIWLGQLTPCRDLVESIIFAEADIPIVQRSLAARALLQLGDQQHRARLTGAIGLAPERFYLSIVWELVIGLFPSAMTLDELIALIEKLNRTNDESASEFESAGVDLVGKLPDVAAVTRYLETLLRILGGTPGNLDHPPDLREKRYSPGIAASALRLLQMVPVEVAPHAAIDAVLRLGERDNRRRSDTSEITAALHLSPARRREAFWRAASVFRGHHYLQGQAVTQHWQLRLLGYDPGIVTDDIEWLLTDLRERPDIDDKRLALSALLPLWRQSGSAADQLQKIQSGVAGNAIAMAELVEALKPQKPSPELIKMEQQSEAYERRNAAQMAARDRNWIDFFAELQAKPEELWSPRPTTEKGADSRLFHLWELLRGVHESKNRFSIDSLGTLGDLLGPELSAAFVAGLGMHWRAWQPKLDSQKAPDQRNQMSTLDLMGIAGLSLEAAGNTRWAATLTRDEALRAAEYSMMEINGFPRWLADLVSAHPDAVQEVYIREIRAELNEAADKQRYEALEDSTRAGVELHRLLAPQLLSELAARDELTLSALNPMLSILLSAAKGDAGIERALTDITQQRFYEHGHSANAAAFLAVLFALNADASTRTLVEKLAALTNDDERTAFLIALLPRIMGGHWRSRNIGVTLPFSSLVQVIGAAYNVLRPESDPVHVGVFSPSPHDDAADSRNLAFSLLVDIPGRATFEALRGFAKIANFPIAVSRLQQIAIERAEKDSDQEPWPLSEAYEFERSRHFAPRSSQGLQDLAVNRLRDIQHDLLNADFAQGQVVCDLPTERAVQLWIADRFEVLASRSYSVERESHVAGEKEPDIRLRSCEPGASLPIEIKVAESWSFAQLEAALVDQLCGLYLRHDGARHGVLLLVHQDARVRGWKRPGSSDYLTFDLLVEALRVIASNISASDPLAPQPIVATLDVSRSTRSVRSANPPD